MTISNSEGGTWPCNFNPFNPGYLSLTVGVIYEPLVFVNTLENSRTTPWLATGYQWSAANKILTFTIRAGVHFTDGTPLTPADVVYTFDLMKSHPALDISAEVRHTKRS